MEKLYIGTDGEYEDDEILLENPASRPPQHGWLWLSAAFQMLREQWLGWLMISIFIIVLQGVFQYAGRLIHALWFIQPIATLMLAAGMQYAATMQEYDDEPPSIRHLFAPLEGKIFELVLLYALLVGVSVLMGLLFVNVAKHLALWGQNIFMLPRGELILLMLLGLFCFSVVGFVFWFTPALVFLRGESPFTAIGMSVKAGLKNILPFLVFLILQWLIAMGMIFVIGAVHSVLVIMAITIPFFLFYQPFMGLCCYVSYRDIWFDEA